MKKKIFLSIILIASLFAIISCGPKEPKIEKLEVTQSTLYLLKGESWTIQYSVKPATVPVQFKSDNEQIATVSDKGVITVKEVGETYIHLSAQGLQEKLKVVGIESAQLRYSNKAVIVGDSFTLPIEPKEATYKIVMDKEGIVELKGNEVMVKGEGEVVLTLSKAGKEETFTIAAFPEVDYSAASWDVDLLMGDPIQWNMPMVLSAEKALGLRENVGFSKEKGKEQLLFMPKEGVTDEQLLFQLAVYHLNQGPWSRVVYSCVNYPVKTKDNKELEPLKEANAEKWSQLFFYRYPKLIFMMQMVDPNNDDKFYGLLFSHNPPLPTASLSLMMPVEEGKPITHFVVLTLPEDE